MRPFVRTPYNYDMQYDSRLHSFHNDQPTMTVQSTKDDSDINVLVRRFGVTGELNGVRPPPDLVAFEEVFDFQSAMNLIRLSQESFASLPANVRMRFSNDPALYVAFCSDPANIDEARKLGIAMAKPADPVAPPPQKVEIVNPEALRST